jgi:hypothetical protein
LERIESNLRAAWVTIKTRRELGGRRLLLITKGEDQSWSRW